MSRASLHNQSWRCYCERMSLPKWLTPRDPRRGQVLPAVGMAALTVFLAGFAAACGGSLQPTVGPSLSILLAQQGAIILPQDGTAEGANFTVSAPSGAAFSVTGLPTGVSAVIATPAGTTPGTVTLQVNNVSQAAAGTYNAKLVVSDQGVSASTPLQVIIAVVATPSGVSNGNWGEFLSTSFQPASWDDQFFVDFPNATQGLSNLAPQHIRVQALERDIPEKSLGNWDFSYLNAVLEPILSVGDHSPEFQIARAPDFMYDSTGTTFLDPTFKQFAAYCARLVSYYNKGGFYDENNVFHAAPAGQLPIHWWAIYNEPNINNITPQQYVTMYNTVVPAMQQVDPTIQFVAVELSDFGQEPENFLPTFFGGVTAQVDAVGTHFYGTCNQLDDDAAVMSSVSQFASDVRYFHQQLGLYPALANVPVWADENNVNADFPTANNMSACNPGQPWVVDKRANDAYFAAWRPYVFSALQKAGSVALMHWEYDADAQFGEVNQLTNGTYLSYWVDYWLSREMPANALSLPVISTEDATVEVAAVRRADNSVVIMISDHAVANPSDNNGPGAPRTVLLNLTGLGNFTSAQTLTFDASTSLQTGPSFQPVTLTDPLPVTLNGYGTTFLNLQP